MRIVAAVRSIVLTLLLLVVLTLALFRGWAFWRERYDVAFLAPRDGVWLDIGGGARIFSQSQGPKDAPALLIVHGTAAWSGFWLETIHALGDAGYRATAMDLPPFGFSSRDAAGDYSRPAQARRIAAAARAAGGVKPVLVAHSFGAGPALEAALREPDAFAGLIIVSGALALPPEGETAEAPPAALRWLVEQPVVSEPLIAAIATNPLLTRMLLAQMLHRPEAASEAIALRLQRPQWLEGTTAAYARWLPNLLFPDPAAWSMQPERLKGLSLPTAIIWGRQDEVTPLVQGERLARLIPGATLDVIELTGHIPHLEAPGDFLQTLRRRLGELRGQGAG